MTDRTSSSFNHHATPLDLVIFLVFAFIALLPAGLVTLIRRQR